MLAEARVRGDKIVVSDIPLLFEVDDPSAFGAVVLVDAPATVRRDRLLARGLSEVEAERMMGAQLDAASKRTRSDYVIDNDGDFEKLKRIASTVWKSLAARA